MGSDAARDNLVLGYDLNHAHAIGPQSYEHPGPPPPPGDPPPGEPLLGDHDGQNLNNFFTGFETDLGYGTEHLHGAPYLDDRHPNWAPPPLYLGLYGSSVDPHQLQTGTSSMYTHSAMPGNMSLLQPDVSFDGIMQAPPAGYLDSSFTQQSQNHFQPAVGTSHDHQAWLQQYAHNMTPAVVNGQAQVRYGSDVTFHATGYAAPHQAPDVMQRLPEWIQPVSGTNTQPNTRPPTQPSSPNLSRKRKLDDEIFPHPEAMNGYRDLSTNSNSLVEDDREDVVTKSKSSTRKKPKSDVKQEEAASPSEPPTAPWPPNKARSITKPQPAKRPSNRSKRKALQTPEPTSSSSRSKRSPVKTPSRSIKTSSKPKQSARSSMTPGSHRQPLSQDQKKANHTNSEQRRRDATSRAFAEMYDCVPQLETMGKMSTTRKLEQVVKKLKDLVEGNQELRRILGENPPEP